MTMQTLAVKIAQRHGLPLDAVARALQLREEYRRQLAHGAFGAVEEVKSNGDRERSTSPRPLDIHA